MVKHCKPNFELLNALSDKYGWIGVGIFGQYSAGEYETRNFASFAQSNEDPACGSGAGAVGVYLGYHLKRNISTFTLNQGVNLGRLARLNVAIVKQEKGDPVITVGGQANTIVNGSY